MKLVPFKEANLSLQGVEKSAYSQPENLITMCTELSKDEIKKILQLKQFQLKVFNYNRPVHPFSIQAGKDISLPINYRHRWFNCNPTYVPEDGFAILTFPLDVISLERLSSHMKIWISQLTFGSEYQDFNFSAEIWI